MTIKLIRRPRAAAGLAASALGVALTGAALAHSFAVTRVALAAGRGYDTRLATLLVVGVSAATPGVLLTVHGVRLRRGAPDALPHVVGGAGVVLLLCLVLTPNDRGFAIGVAAAAAVIAATLRATRPGGGGR
ncbi:MAG: hypothetical protein ACRDP3_08760 [Streptomyces sp.]|uniref:hypothetical protein n=1 Tax=Streptomyces sp. TaxID=1931 RepID=UPI003D6B63A9